MQASAVARAHQERQDRQARRVELAEQLDARVAAIHAGSRRSYGRPRIVRDLHAQGVRASHERVRKSLKRQGLRPAYKRPYRVTTDSNHKKPIAPNVSSTFDQVLLRPLPMTSSPRDV